MEINIAETATIITSIVACTGYIKRYLRKFKEQQAKEVKENAQHIDKIQKRIEQLDEKLAGLSKCVLVGMQSQGELNQSIVESITKQR